MGIVPECGIMEFRGRSPRNSIIPREGYNTHTLENHSTADLYYDATNQTLHGKCFPHHPYAFYYNIILYAARVSLIVIHP